MNIQFEVIIAYAIGLIALYCIGWLLLVPFKALLKLLINAVVGGLVLWVLNRVGVNIGLYVPVNILTSLTVGLLGVPGVILILILQWIL